VRLSGIPSVAFVINRLPGAGTVRSCAGPSEEVIVVRVCVPVTEAGMVDSRWGRAGRVAVAEVSDGKVTSWEEFHVQWGVLHDSGTEGSHHARVVRFLRDHGVETVVADHMGAGMMQVVERMGLKVFLGGNGDAREAVLAASR
jgi:predicted Fe-Mo cluster-binding NifX family protein